MKDWLIKRITVEELEAAMLRNAQRNEKSGEYNCAPLDKITNTNAWKKMKSVLLKELRYGNFAVLEKVGQE